MDFPDELFETNQDISSKEYPENMPEPMDFDAVIREFIRIYEGTLNNTNPEWQSDDIKDIRFLASDFTIKEILSKENINWQKEQHNKDFFQVFVEAVFKLGVEQGKRLYEKYYFQK